MAGTPADGSIRRHSHRRGCRIPAITVAMTTARRSAPTAWRMKATRAAPGMGTAADLQGVYHGSDYGGDHHSTAAGVNGTEHTGYYGTTTTSNGADHHQPATANYYGANCYNCGSGWSPAGAAAAGAAVGVVAGAAIGAAAAAPGVAYAPPPVVAYAPPPPFYATLPQGCVFGLCPIDTSAAVACGSRPPMARTASTIRSFPHRNARAAQRLCAPVGPHRGYWTWAFQAVFSAPGRCNGGSSLRSHSKIRSCHTPRTVRRRGSVEGPPGKIDPWNPELDRLSEFVTVLRFRYCGYGTFYRTSLKRNLRFDASGTWRESRSRCSLRFRVIAQFMPSPARFDKPG